MYSKPLIYSIAVGLLIFSGCFKEMKTASKNYAYEDGFRVVVGERLDEGKIRYKSIELKEWKALTAQERKKFSLSLSENDSEKMQQQVFKFDKSKYGGNMSFVGVTVQKEGKWVRVDYRVHYNKSTYSYSYRTDGNHIDPIYSGYRDLVANRETVYE